MQESISVILVNSSVLTNRDPAKAWRLLDLRKYVNVLGEESARAQNLPRPITNDSKLSANSDQRLYYAYERRTNDPIGFIKVGLRQLFLVPPRIASFRPTHAYPAALYSGPSYSSLPKQSNGRDIIVHPSDFLETNPLCVLDFYVRQSHRRQGIGKLLFEIMMREEGVPHPSLLAFDRPSVYLRNFLSRHYSLAAFQPQTCNMILYDEFYNQIARLWNDGYHKKLETTSPSPSAGNTRLESTTYAVSSVQFRDLTDPLLTPSHTQLATQNPVPDIRAVEPIVQSAQSGFADGDKHNGNGRNYQVIHPKLAPPRIQYHNASYDTMHRAGNNILASENYMQRPTSTFPWQDKNGRGLISQHRITASNNSAPATNPTCHSQNRYSNDDAHSNVVGNRTPLTVDYSYTAEAIGYNLPSSPGAKYNATNLPNDNYISTQLHRQTLTENAAPSFSNQGNACESRLTQDYPPSTATFNGACASSNAANYPIAHASSKCNPYPQTHASYAPQPSAALDATWNPDSDLSFRERRIRMIMAHGRRADDPYLR